MRLLPKSGVALVTCLTMAATLLASWPAAVRACACSAPVPQRTCCPAKEALKACCHSKAKSCCESTPAKPGCSCDFCGCPPVSAPEPTAPPRPAVEFASTDFVIALLAAPDFTAVPRPGDPAAVRHIHTTSPPPTDLVISLSRLTC
ncbi:MAG TPA: hypothetical protein VKD90_10830 [Gemmataceae bacterium]|nr:hypothetical protein [Gemmataceae bacterium]